jgi:hypothetical protein
MDSLSVSPNTWAVTPSDDLTIAPREFRGIWIGNGGDLTYVTARGNSSLIQNIPSGSMLPFAGQRVLATGTTATGISGVE